MLSLKKFPDRGATKHAATSAAAETVNLQTLKSPPDFKKPRIGALASQKLSGGQRKHQREKQNNENP